MADAPTPFNSLGQILSAGAEETLALGLALGVPADVMFERIYKKYGPIKNDTFADLIELANQGIDAARYQNNLPGGQLPDMGRMPTVQELFGDADEGDRLRYATVWTDPISGATRNVYIDSPVPMTTDEIADAARSTVNKYANQSPIKFGLFDIESIDAGTVQVLYVFSAW